MPALPTVAIPGTPVRVSRLGFGCARLFARVETRASRRLVEAALAVGIRHFDTAPSYAWGQSEQVLGEVLSGAADVTIATKVGVELVGGGPTLAGTAYRLIGRPVLARVPRLKASLMRRVPGRDASPPTATHQRTLSKQEIEASVEHSLKRLRRDHVDLLLVHEPDGIRLDEPTLEVFSELQRSRVVRAFGLGYARFVANPPRFGQVVQSHVAAPVEPAETLRIWHGVLRSADAPESAHVGMDAATRVRRFLAQHPHDGVLFSASTTRQIQQVARAIESA
jgi:aryl-alcohol dehydrogenase-like predicted oxidoreductase